MSFVGRITVLQYDLYITLIHIEYFIYCLAVAHDMTSICNLYVPAVLAAACGFPSSSSLSLFPPMLQTDPDPGRREDAMVGCHAEQGRRSFACAIVCSQSLAGLWGRQTLPPAYHAHNNNKCSATASQTSGTALVQEAAVGAVTREDMLGGGFFSCGGGLFAAPRKVPP